MFPVSLFPMLRFHLQYLFTLLFTLISYKFTCAFYLSLVFTLPSSKLSYCHPHHLGVTTISIVVYTVLIFDFTFDQE
jgi:hypothetical protein